MLRIGYVWRPDPAAEVSAEAARLRALGCEVRVESPAETGGGDHATLHAILELLGPDDQLVVCRLEHLGGGGRAMLQVLERLERRGASLEILTPPLSSRGPGGTALRAALEAVAAAEPVARPRRPAAAQEIRALQEQGVGPVEIARRLGVSRMTVWRKLKSTAGCGA